MYTRKKSGCLREVTVSCSLTVVKIDALQTILTCCYAHTTNLQNVTLFLIVMTVSLYFII